MSVERLSPPVLVLAGIGDSGPTHWQSLWLAADPSMGKLLHAQWHAPDRHAWVRELDAAIAACERPPLLLAHSLACLMVAHWAAGSTRAVAGALLVSVPDPHGPGFPAAALHFDAVPMQPLPCPSIVVASTNDPYGTLPFMRRCADAWGSCFVDVGPLGHVNAESGLGLWPQGLALLQSLARSSAPAGNLP